MSGPQPEVEQAAAILVTVLGIEVTEARSWLRAYASATGRDVEAVACDVVAARLRPCA